MFVRSSALLVCLLYAGHSYAQTNTYTFSSVYEDKSGDVSAPWGNNSSKACQTDTALYFTGQDVNSVDQKPVLYENTGSGWSLIWTGPQDDRQAPSVVCDSSNDVHVLYNKSVTGELVHYKFETATSGPAVNAVPTSILTSGLTGSVFHYMVAFATPNNQQLYVAAPQPESATEDSFEVFSFNIVTGLWYSAAPQRLAWRTGQGWVDLRNDGVFIYPVLTANGGRVFAAAEQYEDGATNAVRKQWMFWDSANYGFTKVE